MSFSRNLPLLLISASTLTVSAQWRDEVGLVKLLDYLQVSDLPTSYTDGVPLMQVEANNGSGNYMPTAGSGTFAVTSGIYTNKTFENVSDEASARSGHANTVGNRYFSTASFMTGTNDISVYSAGGFLFDLVNPFLASQTTIGGISYHLSDQMDPYPGKVASFAWISDRDPAGVISEEDYKDWINRFDYQASEGNTLMVTGLNNGSGSQVPELWGLAYNGISVGRTNGGHSSGDTTDAYVSFGITAGRTKPDVVSPDSATSFATGQVSSVAAYNYGFANSLGDTTVTGNTDLQKAILLAGATKEEFPNWSNMSTDGSETRPLDETFGAGEINAFHTHRLIEAGEHAGGNLARYGWVRPNDIAGSDLTYSFTVPEQVDGAEINVALCWHREIAEQSVRQFFSTQWAYVPQDLADLRLSLDGGELASPIVSDSSVDNVEYIHIPSLAPGSYTLTLSNNSGAVIPTDAALAWRINLGEAVSPLEADVSDSEILLSDLIPGVEYEVWESPDLAGEFTFVESFTPTGTTHTWAVPAPTVDRHFYRFRYWQ